MTDPGFGLYIHWPFCQAKCPYCDFNSHVVREVNHAAWKAALAREMAHMRALSGPRRVDTVFFGGGTPSLMEPETVGHLLEEADRLWGIAEGAEITLEANPTSVEAARFAGYAAAGVNRLSIGVQALDDADLKALGRLHDVAEAEAAIALARRHFARMSFDLIYARMGQTPDLWRAELARALDMAADHLSLYQLTIEEGTRFHDLFARGKLRVPEDGAAAEMYAITREVAGAAGLPAYEVSNHAVPGAESRHNLIYWRYGLYAGVGPGAHGRLPGATGRLGTSTLRDPSAWMAAVNRDGHGIAETEALSPGDQGTEYLLMSLRLSEGSSLSRFAALAGQPLPAGRVAAMAAEGLLDVGPDRIVATPRGRLLLDRLLAELLA